MSPHRLIFTGNMSYRPNVDAVGQLARNILPKVRQHIPDVELYIVGMDPAPAVAGSREAFSQAVLRLLREPATREVYAAAGRACVEENHNWNTLLPRLEELVTGPLPRPSAVTSAGGRGA